MSKRIVLLALIILSSFCELSWAEDCGLRGFDGQKIVKFNCADSSSSQLRVTTPGGKTRGITLVEENDSSATPFRVRLNDNTIQALGRLPPEISITSCEELQMIGYHPNFPLNGIYTLTQDIDCSATKSSSSTYGAGLWKLGYAAFYNNKGYDAIEASGDEILDELKPTELGMKGFKPIGIYKSQYDPSLGKVVITQQPFTGTLKGNGQVMVIQNLTIKRSDTLLGLFRNASEAIFQDISLTSPYVDFTGGMCTATGNIGSLVGKCFKTTLSNCNVTGSGTSAIWLVSGCDVGGLVGEAEESTFSNCYTTSSGSSGSEEVRGSGFTGGLVAHAIQSSFENCHSGAMVRSNSWSSSGGGLVGWAETGTTLSQCYATGAVVGEFNIHGGLVGNLRNSTLEKSYATGNVSAHGGWTTSGSASEYSDTGVAGGLVGRTVGATLKNCYARGSARSGGDGNTSTDDGAEGSGGLVGMAGSGSLENCYSTGSVSSRGRSALTPWVGSVTGSSGLGGGLVGDIGSSTTISHCFATGAAVNVDVNENLVGGLIGNQKGTGTPTLLNNFWFNGTNSYDIGRIGATATTPSNVAEITKAASAANFYGMGSGTGGAVYAGWDFSNIWKSRDGAFPCFQWQNEDDIAANDC